MNIEKIIPTLYSKKEECCGCTACYAVCSRFAISMEPDEEGFLYPVIDAGKCVKCGMCLKVCPIKVALSYPSNKPYQRH